MFKQIGKNYERETASLTVVGQNKLICKLQHSPYIKVIFNIQNKKRPQILIQQFSSVLFNSHHLYIFFISLF